MEFLKVGDKCLAFHGPLLYEAKVMKTRAPGSNVALTKQGNETVGPEDLPREAEEETVYYIHYKGWKASWDEWVTSARLKEFTLENLKLQKELKNSVLESTTSVSGVSGQGQGRRTIDVSKSMTKRPEAKLDNEQDSNKKPEISLIIPDSLKSLLVDDWEMVTKDHLLVKLPVRTTVEEILSNYRRNIGRKSSVDAEILDEFLAGLKMYFNRSLGNLLLYRFERQQYLELQTNPQLAEKEPSRIYGVEHLMRLIVTMPSLIAQTTMDQQSVGTLKDQIESLLKYVDREKKNLFLKEYENVSPAYEALAKSV